MLDHRIETFLCVCRNMNFTKAASELNLTQPAVSQQIKYMEDYYQTKLFCYSGRKLSLTPQGEYLRNTMETFSHDVHRIRDEIQKIDALKTIHIGATMSIGEYFLPKNLSRFIKSHPDINVSVTINDTASLLSELDSGTIDFLLCEGFFDKEKYDYQLIKKERVLCACASAYETGPVSGIESLFHNKLLLREEGSGSREILERKLALSGYNINHFKSQCILTNPSIIVQLLLDGNGISFLYESVIQKNIEEHSLKSIQIPDFELSHQFNAIWKKGSIFTDLYHEYIQELSAAVPIPK